MEIEIFIENPSRSQLRFEITQEQIDDILSNELKAFVFPVKPVYNSKIADNGRTILGVTGSSKIVKRIEIGKQDRADRKFLIDTILHEYYEADIVQNRHTNSLYWDLDRMTAVNRHKWINDKIAEFFKKQEG